MRIVAECCRLSGAVMASAARSHVRVVQRRMMFLQSEGEPQVAGRAMTPTQIRKLYIQMFVIMAVLWLTLPSRAAQPWLIALRPKPVLRERLYVVGLAAGFRCCSTCPLVVHITVGCWLNQVQARTHQTLQPLASI